MRSSTNRLINVQEELRDDIMDEEYLFDQSQLTEREKKELEYKKKVFSLAQEHVKAGEMEKVDRYVKGNAAWLSGTAPVGLLLLCGI